MSVKEKLGSSLTGKLSNESTELAMFLLHFSGRFSKLSMLSLHSFSATYNSNDLISSACFGKEFSSKSFLPDRGKGFNAGEGTETVARFRRREKGATLMSVRLSDAPNKS